MKTFLSQSRSKQKFHCNGFIDSIHFPQKSYFGKSNVGYVRLVKYQIYHSANKYSLVAYFSIACMTFMKDSDEVRKVKTSMFPKILFLGTHIIFTMSSTQCKNSWISYQDLGFSYKILLPLEFLDKILETLTSSKKS